MQESGGMSPELLDMIRNDRLPLAAYGVGHLTPRLSSLLSRVVLACHQTFGSQIIYRSARCASQQPWASKVASKKRLIDHQKLPGNQTLAPRPSTNPPGLCLSKLSNWSTV